MSFISDFRKSAKKVDGVQHSAPGPKFWISTGSYIINKIISGHYLRGIGQGKLAMLAGPSGAGKSFVTGNIIKAAQDDGYGIYVIDSENALDDAYMTAIGVDTEDAAYVYSGVSTISQAIALLSKFLKSYRDTKESQPFLVVVDSLDAMLTDGAKKKYDEGDTGGDQGQQVKQLKAALAPIMQDIKDLDVAVLCTKQVYKSQKMGAANSPITEWELTAALLYAFSQVALVTRLLLKNNTDKSKFDGVVLKVFGAKTRFTKPFQRGSIEVPYATGMDPFTGILDAAVSVGVVTQKGSWYSFNGKNFQASNFNTVQDDVLAALVEMDSRVALDVITADAVDETYAGFDASNLEEKVEAMLESFNADTAEIDAKVKKTKKAK